MMVRAQWPSNETDFADPRLCPSCFEPINAARCGRCGLDLQLPRLAQVLALSQSVSRLVADRAALLGSIRQEQLAREEQRARDARAAADRQRAEDEIDVAGRMPSSPEPAASHAGVDPRRPAGGAAVPAGDAAVGPHSRAPLRHRFSMQFTILGVGVLLTSVGATVFLLWAYLVVGLEMRSLIIAGASAGVLALAWFLQRRGLVATGEGIGVVAVVLLLLDAWIVRANDAFGSAAVEQLAYHGAAALVLAAILGAARRATGLRVTGYAAAALAPLGLAAVTASLVPDRGADRWWVAGLAALCLAIAVARLLPRARPTTVTLVLSAVVGLCAPIAAPDALAGFRWHGAVALLAAGLLWGVLALALRAAGTDPRLRATTAAIAGASTATAPVLGALQELSAADAAWFAPAGAAVAAVLVAFVAAGGIRRRPSDDVAAADAVPAAPGSTRPGLRTAVPFTASIAATAVTVAAALVGILAGGLRILAQLAAAAVGWQDGLDPLTIDMPSPALEGPAAVIAPLAVAVALTALIAAAGRIHSHAVAPAACLVWASLAAATTLPAAVALAADAVIAWATLSLGVRIGVGRSASTLRPLRILLGASEALAMALLLGIACSRTALWLAGIALLLVIFLGGAALAERIWGPVPAVSVRASRIAAASVVLCLAAAALPAWAGAAGLTLDAPWSAPWVWLALTAAGTLCAVIALPRLSVIDTWAASTAPLVAAATVLAVLAAANVGDVFAGPDPWLAPLVLALIGIGGVARERRSPLRAALAVLAPPAAALAGWNAVPPLFADRAERWVAVAALMLMLTGAGLLIRLPRGAATAIAWHCSSGAVAIVAVVSTLGTERGWLVLLLVAPIPYLSASMAGEPLAGRSAWRHAAWASPVLAVAALWSGLGQTGVSAVEAYTLPAAAVLAAIAVLLALRRPPSAADVAPQPRADLGRAVLSGRAGLIWAAVGIAALPSAIASLDDGVRAVLTACAGAIVLTLAAWSAPGWRGLPLRPALTAGGGAAICGAGVVRGVALAVQGDPTADGWAVVVLLGGLVTAVLYDRVTAAPATVSGRIAATAIVLGAAPALLLPVAVLAPLPLLLAPVCAAAVLHAAAYAPPLHPLTLPQPRWAALGVLILLGLVTVTAGRVAPFELVTVTTGASMLAAGLLGDRRWLAWTGAATAFVPSIAAAGEPVLRAVIVVAVAAALLAGAGWIPRSVRSVPLRMIALACAAAGTIGAAGLRSLALAVDPALPASDRWAVLEPWGGLPGAAGVWSTVALAGGLVAAALLQRTRTAPGFLAPWLASCAVAVAALAPVAMGVRGTESAAVLIALVAAFAVLRVAIALPRAGFWTHPLLGSTAGIASGLVGAAALCSGRIDPFDAVTAMVGLSLIAAGTLRLARSTVRSSWPALGPGLVVLLVPSLLADVHAVPWRLFALGVAALLVMLAGIRFRLQAPFLIGAAVLVVHGLVQLWPVVAQNYGRVWWWLWLAVAGVLLIVIAATYERQLRLAKRMIRSVASLR